MWYHAVPVSRLRPSWMSAAVGDSGVVVSANPL